MDDARTPAERLDALYRRLTERGMVAPALPTAQPERVSEWNGVEPIRVNLAPPAPEPADPAQE